MLVQFICLETGLDIANPHIWQRHTLSMFMDVCGEVYGHTHGTFAPFGVRLKLYWCLQGSSGLPIERCASLKMPVGQSNPGVSRGMILIGNVDFGGRITATVLSDIKWPLNHLLSPTINGLLNHLNHAKYLKELPYQENSVNSYTQGVAQYNAFVNDTKEK